MSEERNIEILKNIKEYMQSCIDEGYHKFVYNDLGHDEKCIDIINAIDDLLDLYNKIREKIEYYEQKKKDLLGLPDDCAKMIASEDCDEKLYIYKELLDGDNNE